MKNFDLIIIGAGPAGYVAAIRAAQLGLKTALVEKHSTLGGTCLNVGCIPSKALLDSSEKFEMANEHFESHGISVAGVKMDVKTMIKRKEGVISKLTGGLDYLMKKNKITVINGWGKITAQGEVTIDNTTVGSVASDSADANNKEKITAKNILIAAGSKPVELPFAKFDGKTIISSKEALSLTKVPKHLIVIGAGVIGLELGSVWRRLGAKVTVIDIADRPLAVMDSDLGKEAAKIFTAQGVEFMLGSGVESVKAGRSGTAGKPSVSVKVKATDGKSKTVKGEKVLVAVGRRAATENMGLEEIGIKMERGVIQIDANYQTNVAGIYAIGDCVPGPMLAHKGEEEGIACVEKIAGQAGHVNYDCIPSVVYTTPEVAGVGLTEDELKAQKTAYKSGKFGYAANGRAVAMDETQGFVKVLADKKTDKILGVHIIGHNASEMIAEAVIAMEFGASAEDLARTVHAHPTMSEATKEAALAVGGGVIHG